jgi:hypothetical protein
MFTNCNREHGNQHARMPYKMETNLYHEFLRCPQSRGRFVYDQFVIFSTDHGGTHAAGLHHLHLQGGGAQAPAFDTAQPGAGISSTRNGVVHGRPRTLICMFVSGCVWLARARAHTHTHTRTTKVSEALGPFDKYVLLRYH